MTHLTYLSLFTGAGGGDLAMQHLLGFKCKGYVEYENYCQEVIKQRITDGLLDSAPIFGDIRAFISEGYAESYQGMVDLITGGFPCQPFSVAGKQAGENDPRNMWPQTIKTIGIVRPAHVLLENVPGIRAYLPVVIRDLRRDGYTVSRPTIVAAASLGAGHIRRRVWIYANIDKEGFKDTAWQSPPEEIGSIGTTSCLDGGAEVSADVNETWELQQKGGIKNKRKWSIYNSWWENEPNLVRVVHGVPYGVDRIGALGNAQVPIVAATAWEILNDR